MKRDAREVILRRRQRFLLAALSGAAVLSACTQPEPCLEPGPVSSTSAAQGGDGGTGGVGTGGEGAGGSTANGQ